MNDVEWTKLNYRISYDRNIKNEVMVFWYGFIGFHMRHATHAIGNEKWARQRFMDTWMRVCVCRAYTSIQIAKNFMIKLHFQFVEPYGKPSTKGKRKQNNNMHRSPWDWCENMDILCCHVTFCNEYRFFHDFAFQTYEHIHAHTSRFVNRHSASTHSHHSYGNVNVIPTVESRRLWHTHPTALCVIRGIGWKISNDTLCAEHTYFHEHHHNVSAAQTQWKQCQFWYRA